MKLERHLHTMGEIVSLFSYMWQAYISVHLYTLVHVPMCHDAGCTYMFYAKRCFTVDFFIPRVALTVVHYAH